MKRFIGFRAGQERQVALPESFFTELLPLVDDLGELKATLACWRILAGQAYVRWQDLAADQGLAGLDDKALRDGLERAVARGALLRVQARGQDEEWFLVNTEQGRAAVSALQKGELPQALAPTESGQAHLERPNIFELYEQSVGLLSPLIADELRDAEATFPASWIEDAFREAARHNVRSWAYVRKVLERRAQRDRRAGPPDGDASDEWKRFLRGES